MFRFCLVIGGTAMAISYDKLWNLVRKNKMKKGSEEIIQNDDESMEGGNE